MSDLIQYTAHNGKTYTAINPEPTLSLLAEVYILYTRDMISQHSATMAMVKFAYQLSDKDIETLSMNDMHELRSRNYKWEAYLLGMIQGYGDKAKHNKDNNDPDYNNT